MPPKSSYFALFLLGCWLPCTLSAKPHIVFFLVDDLGYYDVGWNNPELHTPNIDSLVKSGALLNRHYSYKYCSPTRSSLLSGRLPIHVNEFNSDWDLPGTGMPKEMTGLAKKLKQAGYATHQVGKWHAGQASLGQIPLGRGFDTSLGYFDAQEDHWTQLRDGCGIKMTDLWKTDKPAFGLNNTMYGGNLYNNEAVKLINEHDPTTPFFLYYAFQNCHEPLEVPQSYIDKYATVDNLDRRTYYAMITFVDEMIGNVVKALQTKGLWDNTLVVLSADNGGPTYQGGGGNNYPLKGGKISDWEGGVRLIAFVAGGFLPKKAVGTIVDGYIHICDWYATFSLLAGVDPTDNVKGLPPIDSLNVWPLVTGDNTTSPRVEIPLSSFNGMNGDPIAINFISGPYKLIQGIEAFASWTGKQYPNNTGTPVGFFNVQNCTSGCLYNIIEDPTEHNELSTKMPAILNNMLARANEIFKTVYNPDRGNPDPKACQLAQKSGYFAPWLP